MTRSLDEPDARVVSPRAQGSASDLTGHLPTGWNGYRRCAGPHPSLGSEGPGLRVGGARLPAEGQVGVNGATWWLPRAPHPGAPEA